MPAIKPVSDLRSYNDVLAHLHEGAPVFLTKNGHGRYAVLDMRGYDKLQVGMRLLEELEAGRNSGEQSGWLNKDDVLAQSEFEATLDAAVQRQFLTQIKR